jgi:2-polyprenyl-3-methyl-5-hydroxy-6-metoxy-1,4-benzoquinol methylase
LKEDLFECLDCFQKFTYRWGLRFDDRVFSEYDITEDYDNFMRTRYVKLFLDLKQDDMFLDAGCGFGFFTLYAGTIVNEAVGIDLQDWVLKSATRTKERLKMKNVNFKCASLYHLPFPDNFFNKVLCAEVMEHILYPEQAVQELSRVCDGTLVIQIPTTTWLKKLGGRIFGSEFKEIDKNELPHEDRATFPHVQIYVAKSMIDMLQLHGFQVTDCAGVRLVPLNLFTRNKPLIFLEYFFDLTLGTRFPLNTFGTMTIFRCEKRV